MSFEPASESQESTFNIINISNTDTQNTSGGP